MENKRKYKPRLPSREAEKLIGGWLARADRPLRWSELAAEAKKKNLSGRVLTADLKSMIAKGFVDTRAMPDETGRQRVHYMLGLTTKDPTMLPEFEKRQSKIYEQFMSNLKKAGKNEQKRKEALVAYFDFMMVENVRIYLASLDMTLNSKSINFVQGFEYMLTLLATVPAMYLGQVFSENRDIAQTVIAAVSDQLNKQIEVATKKH